MRMIKRERLNMVRIASVFALVTIAGGCATAQSAKNSLSPELTNVDIKESLAKNFPSTKITEVRKSELDGIYEVVMGKNIVYTDAKARYFLFGHLFDMPEQKDLTQVRLEQLSVIRFADLPKDEAIVFKRGDGRREVAVFSDPDCPYCRRLEPELAKLDNVTVYLYLMPLSIHPEAKVKSINIWCAQEPQNAWRNLMLENKEPAAAKDCTNPVDKIATLGRDLGITGTPTLISGDGRIRKGALRAEEIDQWLGGGKS